MFPAAAYQPKNETVYYDWSYLQMQIIQDHSQHVRLSQRTTSVCRVLHPSLSEIPVTHNLMQVSVTWKTFHKAKQFMWCVAKKERKPRTLSWKRAICNGEKGVHKFVGYIELFDVHKNKLAYLQYTVHSIFQALFHQ